MSSTLQWLDTTDLDRPVCLEDDAPTLRALLGLAASVARRLGPLAQAEPMTVACGDRYHLAAAVLGTWAAGGVVALPPGLQHNLIAEIAQHEASGVLHDGHGPEGGLDVTTLEPNPDITWLIDALVLPADRDIAILHTSGTTGHAVAIHKTAQQLLGEAMVLARTFGCDSPRVVSTVPAIHIFGLLFSILVPLASAGAFSRQTPLYPETVAASIASGRADTLVSVPAHLRSLESLDPGSIDSSLRIFSSGAPLPSPTGEALHGHLGLVVTEVFGSTETGGIAHRPSVGDRRWQTLPGVTVGTTDDGLLLLSSSFLAPSETQPRVCADKIEQLDGTHFRLLGRVDDVVKVAGKRVATGDVQARLLALEGVDDAGVIAVPEAGRGFVLKAAVVSKVHTRQSLREALRLVYDPVLIPRVFKLVPELPRTTTGKLRRDMLQTLLADNTQ